MIPSRGNTNNKSLKSSHKKIKIKKSEKHIHPFFIEENAYSSLLCTCFQFDHSLSSPTMCFFHCYFPCIDHNKPNKFKYISCYGYKF